MSVTFLCKKMPVFMAFETFLGKVNYEKTYTWRKSMIALKKCITRSAARTCSARTSLPKMQAGGLTSYIRIFHPNVKYGNILGRSEPAILNLTHIFSPRPPRVFSQPDPQKCRKRHVCMQHSWRASNGFVS